MTPAVSRQHLQSRNVGEIPGVRGEQTEITLNGLRAEPEVVDANVWVFAGLPELGGQHPERFTGFRGDSQLRFSTRPAKHCRRCFEATLQLLLLMTYDRHHRGEADQDSASALISAWVSVVDRQPDALDDRAVSVGVMDEIEIWLGLKEDEKRDALGDGGLEL